MRHHYCDHDDIDRKHLDVGFVKFMMIEHGDPFFSVIAFPFSIPERACRGIKDAYYHLRKVPHVHSTMADYLR